jgi:cytochrome P450
VARRRLLIPLIVMDGNPLDPDPERRHAVMQSLRATASVVPFPGVDGVVAAVRYDSVGAGLRRVEEFGGSAAQDGLPEADTNIAGIPEPRHGQIRRIINSVVAFHKSQRIEPYLQELTARLLDDVLARAATAGDEGVDVMAGLADAVPPAAMAHVLGFPETDARAYYRWADEIGTRFQAAAANGTNLSMGDACPEFAAYVDARIEERRSLPRDEWPEDALTRFLVTEVDGERLEPRAIRTQIMFMIGAGSDTTRNLIGNLLFRLALDPKAYAALRADRTLVDVAVEEALRLDAPAQFLVRTCLRDTDLVDASLTRGQRVFMCIGSGNRDETVFEAAGEFRLDRGANDHLSFGTGSHICPGSALARLEARTVLAAFVERVERFGLAPGYTFDALASAMLQGPKTLFLLMKGA